MTILIALKDRKNSKIIFGADKQVTFGQMVKKATSKIITLYITIRDDESIEKKELWVGLCGYNFMKNFFQYGFEIPIMDKNENFISYLYQKFFPKIREKITENLLVEINNGQIDTGSGMLLIFDEEIYHIGSNFCIDVIDSDYYIMGSGVEVGLGSVYTNIKYHKELDKKEIVKQAIECVGRNTIYCNDDVEINEIYY